MKQEPGGWKIVYTPQLQELIKKYRMANQSARPVSLGIAAAQGNHSWDMVSLESSDLDEVSSVDSLLFPLLSRQNKICDDGQSSQVPVNDVQCAEPELLLASQGTSVADEESCSPSSKDLGLLISNNPGTLSSGQYFFTRSDSFEQPTHTLTSAGGLSSLSVGNSSSPSTGINTPSRSHNLSQVASPRSNGIPSYGRAVPPPRSHKAPKHFSCAPTSGVLSGGISGGVASPCASSPTTSLGTDSPSSCISTDHIYSSFSQQSQHSQLHSHSQFFGKTPHSKFSGTGLIYPSPLVTLGPVSSGSTTATSHSNSTPMTSPLVKQHATHNSFSGEGEGLTLVSSPIVSESNALLMQSPQSCARTSVDGATDSMTATSSCVSSSSPALLDYLFVDNVSWGGSVLQMPSFSPDTVRSLDAGDHMGNAHMPSPMGDDNIHWPLNRRVVSGKPLGGIAFEGSCCCVGQSLRGSEVIDRDTRALETLADMCTSVSAAADSTVYPNCGHIKEGDELNASGVGLDCESGVLGAASVKCTVSTDDSAECILESSEIFEEIVENKSFLVGEVREHNSISNADHKLELLQDVAESNTSSMAVVTHLEKCPDITSPDDPSTEKGSTEKEFPGVVCSKNSKRGSVVKRAVDVRIANKKQSSVDGVEHSNNRDGRGTKIDATERKKTKPPRSRKRQASVKDELAAVAQQDTTTLATSQSSTSSCDGRSKRRCTEHGYASRDSFFGSWPTRNQAASKGTWKV